MLTQAKLKKILNYNPETGIFIWIAKCARKVVVGKVAGSLQPTGYNKIRIDKVGHCAHRLAWLYMTGEWPKDQIDHIDGARANNRWANLREATTSINRQNLRAAISRSKTGVLGVRQSHKSTNFEARLYVDGKTHYIGTFQTIDLAHAAYLKMKRRLHPGCTI